MIGERLAEIRTMHGDKQATLAKKLNVAAVTVSKWEQELSSPAHETFVRLCKLYQVSADYLLGLTPHDPEHEYLRRLEMFSKEEREQIQDFENYLLWKKEKQKNDTETK